MFFALCVVGVGAQSMFEITLKQAQGGDPKAMNNLAAYYKEAGNCG